MKKAKNKKIELNNTVMLSSCHISQQKFFDEEDASEGQMKGQIIVLVNGIGFYMLAVVLIFLFYIKQKILLLSLSHDIKTPLSAIKLYAKALSKNLYQEERKKVEIAENINDKVDEIEGYISEIVRASNEDFLHFEVKNGEFYIKEVLESIREYYEDKMALNQIEFQVGNYSNCLVYGDKDRLVGVLQNIIENAIKYGDGRKIRLEMNREEEEYKILVFNTGCQLPDKELSHIFDSFFRGSNVAKKPESGLGLYICIQLMHLMEGEVTAAIVGKDGETCIEVKVILHLV